MVDSNCYTVLTSHFQQADIDSFKVPSDGILIDSVLGTRVRSAQDPFPALSFDQSDINRLLSSTGLLNDICINGCSALLYSQFTPPPGSITVFSTYELHRIRCGANDEVLWRNTKQLCYWETSVWILPIHRPASNHWVVCKIDFTLKQIDLFDSFAQKMPWKDEIKVAWFHPCTKATHSHPCSILCSLSTGIPR